ncbi:MAG: DMT family transporter [Pseudomonadota bacterium]
MKYAGELAALGTAVCWAMSSNLFAAAGKRMGAVVLNRLRITVAGLFLATALLITRGSPWPFWATPTQVALLALSGLVGFAWGDYYYFRSLVILGPGRATLLSSTAPLFTLIFAWPLLGELPGPIALLGMALTLAGIFTVLKPRSTRWLVHARGATLTGVYAGVLASIGQAGGYVISKQALHSGLDALSATVIRIAAGAVAVWLLAAFRERPLRSFEALRNRRAASFMIGGAFLGPFLGVTLSLVALQFIEAGVASSITAIFPVLALFVSWRFHGEKLTIRTLVGTLVAVAGVVVLFTR